MFFFSWRVRARTRFGSNGRGHALTKSFLLCYLISAISMAVSRILLYNIISFIRKPPLDAAHSIVDNVSSFRVFLTFFLYFFQCTLHIYSICLNASMRTIDRLRYLRTRKKSLIYRQLFLISIFLKVPMRREKFRKTVLSLLVSHLGVHNEVENKPNLTSLSAYNSIFTSSQ